LSFLDHLRRAVAITLILSLGIVEGCKKSVSPPARSSSPAKPHPERSLQAQENPAAPPQEATQIKGGPPSGEIVKAMADNPDWKLRVDGHTDNLGGDPQNLDLSKRRATSVKNALVERYYISADRLATNGFGASSPIDRNDTLEGRARNHRTELSRE
jgi:OmpA family